MEFPVIDQKIRNAFSGAAKQYEQLTSLHRDIGGALIAKIREHDCGRSTLDIGMGTGWFTRKLANIFPETLVVGLDFASGMISCAQKKEAKFKIVQADASHLPFKENTFDMITSNLAYQWVEDLSRAFQLCHSRLKKNGVLCLSMFGQHTFQELFEVLEVCVDKKNDNDHFLIRRLAGKDQVTEALKDAGFHKTCVTSEYRKVYFSDMMSLVKWIKNIGANTISKNIYIGKDLLARARTHYNARFKDSLGVYATFEVIWAEAKK